MLEFIYFYGVFCICLWGCLYNKLYIKLSLYFFFICLFIYQNNRNVWRGNELRECILFALEDSMQKHIVILMLMI